MCKIIELHVIVSPRHSWRNLLYSSLTEYDSVGSLLRLGNLEAGQMLATEFFILSLCRYNSKRSLFYVEASSRLHRGLIRRKSKVSCHNVLVPLILSS